MYRVGLSFAVPTYAGVVRLIGEVVFSNVGIVLHSVDVQLAHFDFFIATDEAPAGHPRICAIVLHQAVVSRQEHGLHSLVEFDIASDLQVQCIFAC